MLFQPQRSSTPQLDFSVDLSIASAAELTGLNEHDIDIIDAIVQRAGPESNTFLTVFKAYNDIMVEHGLDPHEVMYYGKLLKLGTLRGTNWGEKWSAVKNQHGYNSTEHYPTAHHNETTQKNVGSDIPTSPRSQTDSEVTNNSLGLNFSEKPRFPFARRVWASQHRSAETPSTPPSYRSTAPSKNLLRLQSTPSGLNDEDAWTKIKVRRDEELADRFRDERTMERCWEMWRQGHEWIITTHDQIIQARQQLILRIHFQHWHRKMLIRQDFHMKVSLVADKRLVRSYFRTWYLRLKQHQQASWRQSMRDRMQITRHRREERMMNDAWARWRQLSQSRLADQHYAERLILRLFRQWRTRIRTLDAMEELADTMTQHKNHNLLEDFWIHWADATQLRSIEKIVKFRVGLRVINEVMTIWKKRMADMHSADAFHDLILLKSSIRSWKAATDRITKLDNKANKHLLRQDHVLLRAVVHVWKARANERILVKVKDIRLLEIAWAVWKRRMRNQENQSSQAYAFAHRTQSALLTSMFTQWRQTFISHQNAQAFASYRYSVSLCARMLHRWQEHFIYHLKMIKKARQRERLLCLRTSWTLWADKLQQKRVESLLIQFQTRQLAQLFKHWRLRARQRYQVKLAETIHRFFLTKHILTHWTNHVIAIKERELNVTQRYEEILSMKAFGNWKRVWLRHREELDLMASYQDVKREENMRRIFHQWLAASRASRHRRLTLERKEKELRLTTLATFWDRWRERFKEHTLRPLEYQFLIQSQRNALFSSFGLWQSKTKTLPAIRFHASHTRFKFWQVWRQAMPVASQARAAREMDKRRILSAVFTKWSQAHKTKIALKAVARARYLRLPAQPIRPSAPTIFAGRTVRRMDQTGDERVEVVRPFAGKPRSEASLPRTRESSPARSAKSSVTPWYSREARNVVVRSEQGDDDSRSRLWQEFKSMHLRTKTRSNSRSREPP